MRKKIPLLGELKPGVRAEIVGFNPATKDQEAFLHRLFEVGFLTGSMLEVLQESPYAGDPISIRIKEATYALRARGSESDTGESVVIAYEKNRTRWYAQCRKNSPL